MGPTKQYKIYFYKKKQIFELFDMYHGNPNINN